MKMPVTKCAECQILTEENENLRTELDKIKQEHAWLKGQLFGQKSERFIPENPLQLELDLGVKPKEVETKTQKVTYERKETKTIKGHSRETMPTHLPFIDVYIEPDENIEGCKKIGEEITWEYVFEPGSLKVRRFIRPKYSRPENQGVAIAALPPRPVEKGNFGPEFMAAVTIDKYLYHMPLFRQIKKIINEYDVEFSESVFCDIVKNTVFWLDPVYDIFKKDLLEADYLQVDETRIPVLINSKKGKTHKGYYWVYYDPLKKIVVFEYCHSRKKEHPFDFLKTFNGKMQIDGYPGYKCLIDREGIDWATCMDHVRRKFKDALSYDSEKAGHALEKIKIWYKHEEIAREEGYSFDQRLVMREQLIAEPMKAFNAWCIEQIKDERPTSPIRKACEYAVGQWDGFKPYLSDGRIEISNIGVENAIRPVALGRKNYLFKGSEAAAQRGAVIYSIVATASLHGKNAREYVQSLLKELPGAKAGEIRKFLPY